MTAAGIHQWPILQNSTGILITRKDLVWQEYSSRCSCMFSPVLLLAPFCTCTSSGSNIFNLLLFLYQMILVSYSNGELIDLVEFFEYLVLDI